VTSADGKKLAALEHQTLFWYSSDEGGTWSNSQSVQNIPQQNIPQQYSNPMCKLSSLAMSQNGTKLLAGGFLYNSKNGTCYGAVLVVGQVSGGTQTWTVSLITGNTDLFNSVASSGDGLKLVAVGQNLIVTSSDGGSTWTVRNTTQNWQYVASSSDGTKLLLLVATFTGASTAAKRGDRCFRFSWS
jgi:hypothetical protein